MGASEDGKKPIDFFREMDLSQCKIEERFRVGILNTAATSIPEIIVGYFEDKLTANLYTQMPPTSLEGFPEVAHSQRWVITPVIVWVSPSGPAYLIDCHPIQPMDDEKVLNVARKVTLNKLTPDEKALLKINS